MTESNDPTTGVSAVQRGPEALLQEMFERVVLSKNADLIEFYYHPDFELTSNADRNRSSAHRNVSRREAASVVGADLAGLGSS